jgi:two-component system CheB/CheR fusion protein
LSNDTGEVRVDWNLSEEAKRKFLDFNWEERGGPEVKPAPQTGFGFTLISTMGRSVATSPCIKLDPKGLECRIRIPLETLVPVKGDRAAVVTEASIAADADARA